MCLKARSQRAAAAFVCWKCRQKSVSAVPALILQRLIISFTAKMRREVSEQKHKEVAWSYRPPFSIIIFLPRHFPVEQPVLITVTQKLFSPLFVTCREKRKTLSRIHCWAARYFEGDRNKLVSQDNTRQGLPLVTSQKVNLMNYI